MKISPAILPLNYLGEGMYKLYHTQWTSLLSYNATCNDKDSNTYPYKQEWCSCGQTFVIYSIESDRTLCARYPMLSPGRLHCSTYCHLKFRQINNLSCIFQSSVKMFPECFYIHPLLFSADSCRWVVLKTMVKLVQVQNGKIELLYAWYLQL